VLDPKLLRSDLTGVAAQLARRGFVLDVVGFAAIEERRKAVQIEADRLRAERNANAKAVGFAKAKGQDCAALLATGETLGVALEGVSRQLEQLQTELENLQLGLPNILHASVPAGTDEAANVEIRRWREPAPLGFEPKDHVALGERLGMDFEAAGRISGARFVVLTGALARLHRSLVQFMLDLHTSEHGYCEAYVPYLVHANALVGTGQLPKFAQDLFAVGGDPGFFLIPTAEVPVTNLVRDQILGGETLPLKFVAHTPCFRSEAGAAGKDTRGMIRQHQFDKVEMFVFTTLEQAAAEHERILAIEEEILAELGLAYRVVNIAVTDLGNSAAKKYDCEAWLPSQGRYRELTSCSNTTDYQARRLHIRVRRDKQIQTLHTLNGTAVAVGRTLVALLENGQQADGGVELPECLVPYGAPPRLASMVS